MAEAAEQVYLPRMSHSSDTGRAAVSVPSHRITSGNVLVFRHTRTCVFP